MISLRITFLALQELSKESLLHMLAYRFGLAVGHFRRVTPPVDPDLLNAPPLKPNLFSIPDVDALQSLWEEVPLNGNSTIRQIILDTAEEIIHDKVRLFGADPLLLTLVPPDAHLHWTQAQKHIAGDVKLIWESARFGWVFALGRAYAFTQDERYARFFWRSWEAFVANNPVNCGVNWASAQEVAFRIIAWLFAAQVFAHSPTTTPERLQALSAALVEHARRIPPTLVYARAQNNNHLVSEAVGLYLAGVYLKGHPQADQWKALGKKWFDWSAQNQIDEQGEYIQHSTNYHRLVLQLALIFRRASLKSGEKMEDETLRKLGLAVGWLWAHFDRSSGKAANLGHNDGTLLLPFGSRDFGDYRPTLQAAACAFSQAPALPKGAWDELYAWLEGEGRQGQTVQPPAPIRDGCRVGNASEWARMRAAHYSSRPAHADQLQVDFWYNGTNIVLDAGTYAYNLPAPWKNGLASALVHNSPLINHQEPMLRAGKFLWLQWDQAHVLKEETLAGMRVAAQRNGYRKLGLIHQRRLEYLGEGDWKINDRVVSDVGPSQKVDVQINWLFPDQAWKLTGDHLLLKFRSFQAEISVEILTGQAAKMSLIRAGKLLEGEGEIDPRLGWVSPTYNKKIPALTYQLCLEASLPVEISTRILIHPTPDSALD